MLPTIVIKVTKGLALRIDEKQLFLFSPAPDLLLYFLQETHWTADMEIELQRDWQGRVSYTHGKKSARASALLISSRLDHSVKETKRDSEGRVLNLVI